LATELVLMNESSEGVRGVASAQDTEPSRRGSARAARAAARDASARAGRSKELLGERAYGALRDRIVTVRIPPGALIDEEAVAEELEMGRTPVREAIKRLELEKLVTVFPRRGTFAAGINVADLARISDVRSCLEGHAAYRAAERLTDEQRIELDELLRELCGSQGSSDHEELLSLDTRVHRFIYRCAGNPYLEDTLGLYLNLSLRIWYVVLDRLPHLLVRVNEHSDVLGAIAAGDGDRARALLIEHISTFEREVQTVL
jgi:DNA-binding GntR family transcriptional regulator